MNVAYWRYRDYQRWGERAGAPYAVDPDGALRPTGSEVSLSMSVDLDDWIQERYPEAFEEIDDNKEEERPKKRSSSSDNLEEHHLSKGGGKKAPNSKPKGAKYRCVYFPTHFHG
jgi:hypothetical protein